MSLSRRGFLGIGAGVLGGGVGGWSVHGRVRNQPVTVDDSEPNDYRAQLLEVIDGDTADFLVDLGFNTVKEIRVRPIEIDTAEIHGVSHDSNEYELGMEQKEFVQDLLTVDSDDEFPLIFRSEGETGVYGRWLGDVRAGDRWWTEAVLERWPDAVYEN